jgi:elongation factor Ts
MEITATMVKELRDATNLGMMDCKKALIDANGDREQAIKLLRERGANVAVKKAERVAKEGRVTADIYDGGRSGVMIEINCETDFVAKNESFQAFLAQMVVEAHNAADGQLAEAAREKVVAKIQEIGENIIIRRNTRYQVSGNGSVAGYIHLGGKVGVLVEVGCEKVETTSKDLFKETVKDITLHIAACNPAYLDRTAVPAEIVAQEREIYAKQVEGKPANIIDKIVEGKLGAFYQQVVLLDQESVIREAKPRIKDVIAEANTSLGASVSVARFARLKVGEASQ